MFCILRQFGGFIGVIGPFASSPKLRVPAVATNLYLDTASEGGVREGWVWGSVGMEKTN